MKSIATAILVDGGFYRRRAHALWGKLPAQKRAEELYDYCLRHLQDSDGHVTERILYRIFYYDCPPVDRIVYNPLTRSPVDLGKSDTYAWSRDFFAALLSKRKLAIRHGRLSDNATGYRLKDDALKRLLSGKVPVSGLTDDDLSLEIGQKGVDVKIGIDLVHLAYRRIVDQVVLITGDSDFVPAAKLARREGLDVILDPMGAHIASDLSEHIDGLKTHIRDIRSTRSQAAAPSP